MLDARKRMRILDVARSFLGVPYDHAHLDASWQEAVPVAFDAATFVCRVVLEALEDSCSLQANAAWLLDNLATAESPIPGDVVGYQRSHASREPLSAAFHVMLYAGSGNVIGACDLAGSVVVRPMDYEPGQWRSLIEAPSFRLLGPRRKSGPIPLAVLPLRKR